MPVKWHVFHRPCGKGRVLLCSHAMTSENGQAAVPAWTLGDRLRKAREVTGFTQEQMALELAARLGRPVRHSTIAAWERDKNQPRNLMALVGAWSEVTGIDRAWLLGIDPQTPRILATSSWDDVEQLALALSAA